MNKKNIILLITAIIIVNLLIACGPVSAIINLADSRQISGAESTKGYLTISDGRLVEYSLLIPAGWKDKYELRKEGYIAYYEYATNPKAPLFWLEAFTVEQWQEVQQEPGHGEELFAKEQIVYVYHIALDNPYTGEQAEEYQQMAGQVKEIVRSLTVSIATNPDEMIVAGKALIDFFYKLSNRNYAEAAALYGGSYENLVEMNPLIDPNDHGALLENACSINGFQCLPMKQIVRGRQEWPDTFVFTLEFLNPDGSLFQLRSCCGESETSEALQSQFDFTVQRTPQVGNIFLVQDLPVYVP